jgi:hypothetical protein
MDALIQDFRCGVRQLFSGRGSSIVAVLTLALGIGVTTAVLSVIDATILRPLPYPEPEQLVDVYFEEVLADGTAQSPSPSMEDMRLVEAADDLFSIVAGYGTVAGGRRIAEGPEPELIAVEYFTENYLSMYGVTPTLGRGFSTEDMDHGAPLVALLGYGYWQRRYGGRADVIGQRSAWTPTWQRSSVCSQHRLAARRRSSRRCGYRSRISRDEALDESRSTRGCDAASRSTRRATD